MCIEFEKKYGPLDKNTLLSLEQIWEFKLPKNYREFFLKFNGGTPIQNNFSFKEKNNGSIIHHFFGLFPIKYINILYYLEMYKNRVPSNTFPIASDVCGNLILISVKNADRGKIYFWDHEMEADNGETPDYSNLTLIADSFDEFINGLRSADELDIKA